MITTNYQLYPFFLDSTLCSLCPRRSLPHPSLTLLSSTSALYHSLLPSCLLRPPRYCSLHLFIPFLPATPSFPPSPQSFHVASFPLSAFHSLLLSCLLRLPPYFSLLHHPMPLLLYEPLSLPFLPLKPSSFPPASSCIPPRCSFPALRVALPPTC